VNVNDAMNANGDEKSRESTGNESSVVGKSSNGAPEDSARDEEFKEDKKSIYDNLKVRMKDPKSKALRDSLTK
jgi:hypothetical protein